MAWLKVPCWGRCERSLRSASRVCCGKAVALGVFLAKHCVARGNFNAGDMNGGVAHNGAEGGHTGADARLEDGFTGNTRNGGGKKHGINSSAIALFGLEHAKPAPQKCVLSQ